MKQEIQFLNVDLELESKHDISVLVSDLSNKAVVLHYDKDEFRQLARIEAGGEISSPDKAINHLCELIESCSKAGLKQWLSCSKRTFDLGFSSGFSPKCFSQALHVDTLLRISAIGAGMEITLYPIES
ncbi:putative orphan protein [Pseudoalteromonas luteoviolacea B = ATCC 29581]|nr:putative orphan protein [Pseudoalteromonas luteoviolacea B = ATCC 29581]